MGVNEIKPESFDERGGGVGWGLLIGGIVLWDTLAPETLTNSFMRGRENESQTKRALTVGSLAITTAHLMDWLPDTIDPIDNIGKGLGMIRAKLEDWTFEGVRIP